MRRQPERDDVDEAATRSTQQRPHTCQLTMRHTHPSGLVCTLPQQRLRDALQAVLCRGDEQRVAVVIAVTVDVHIA
jgi:hypothetical protein